MSSCKGTDIQMPFKMTEENTKFVYADTSVAYKRDIITLQHYKSIVSNSMPPYYQVGFYIDSVSGPVASEVIKPLVKISTMGYKTGEIIFDNSSAKFIPGNYQVFIGAYTNEGIVRFRNNPINISITPGIQVSSLAKLTALNYTIGELVSVEGSFKASTFYNIGKPLIITLNSPDFEISKTSKTAFSAASSLTFDPTVDLSDNNVYVRMKTGKNVGDSLTGNITVSCEGQHAINIDLAGKVKPIKITTTTTNIISLNYLLGAGPSLEKSFTIGGDVNNNILITAPANYEISDNASKGYKSNYTITKFQGGFVLDQLVYVRLKAGLAKGVYNETMTITSTNAQTVNISLKGEVL